jgi:methyl-accepting chemotaxis protein
MPPPRAAAPTAPTPAAAAPAAAPRAAAEPALAEQLRTEMETRLRRITQDLYVDDELRAHSEERARAYATEAAETQTGALMQNIDQAFSELRADFETVLGQHTGRIDEQQKLIESQNQQIEQLTRTIEAQSRSVEEQNARMDTLLRSMEEQSGRVDTMSRLLEEAGGRADTMSRALEEQQARVDSTLQSMRDSAAQEAHNVAERVVMNAAKRISDQMAESFLRVLQQPIQQSKAG